jgi:hypothetical protein
MMQELGVVEMVLYILGGALIVVPVILTISLFRSSPEAADCEKPETRLLNR